MQSPADLPSLQHSQQHILRVSLDHGGEVLPNQALIDRATSELLSNLPDQSLGVERTTNHLLDTIVPALNRASLSPNYYGFVTGGATPAARVADSIVTAYDQNVAVHLPDQTIATIVEDCALRMLLDLLRLDAKVWSGRTFTTGATASNIHGILCGREYVVSAAVKRHNAPGSAGPQVTVGDHGLLAASMAAKLERIQILTTQPHSSLLKACSVAGIGRSSVIHVGSKEDGITFDFGVLEAHLKRANTASMVVISCSEVNTGFFATHGSEEVRKIRSLCDKYEAWLHVDAAFGLFARVLGDNPEFEYARQGGEGVELADSIAGDAHKLLNVPYDCGFFFCRHSDLAQQVFKNPNAAYLSSTGDSIVSPLNVGLENSRRFRSLPVYATLVSYGREGYRDMLMRQVRLARSVAVFVNDHPAYELLPRPTKPWYEKNIFIIVLFRAVDAELNHELVKRINSTSRIYVSGTIWDGQPASRIAVSNWQVDIERDLKIVGEVLEQVAMESGSKSCRQG